ncbi:MAG: type IV pilus inner membrane component PilO [Steroidobacteraceae bacterium]
MNVQEVLEELRGLDPRDPGRWPLPVLAGVVGLTFVVLTLVLVYLFVWQTVRPELVRREQQEQALRQEFMVKHAVAANLNVYRKQLKDLRRSFGTLLRQLPGKTQVPNLLEDISDTASAAGLKQRLFKPGKETQKEFYAVLPIQMELTGSYHQFGAFVSDIAALSRIVTLHDIQIKPIAKGGFDELSLTLTAKTYRYLTADEMSAQRATKHKFARPARRGPR